MGGLSVNANFNAHGGLDTSEPKRRFILHRNSPALNEEWTFTVTIWRSLAADARNGDKADFLTKIKAATSPYSWSTEEENAAWDAAVTNWD